MRNIISIILVFVSLVVFSFSVGAQTDTNITKNQYGIVVEHHPLSPETWNGIISFSSKEHGYRMWFDNRVYVDGAYYFDKNTYNPIGNGVTIRRARFAVKTTLYHNWYGEIDLDFAGSQTEMKDMIIGYNFTNESGIFKNMKIKAGNFKEGFSMEETTTSRYVTFIERSLMSKFTPSRHIGVQASKYGNHYLAIAGVHFQDVGGAEEVSFSQTHNKKAGMDEGYSLTGRLVLLPIVKQDMVLHFGVAGSYRTPKTSWEVSDGYRISSRAMTSVNRKKYLDTDDITNTKYVTLAGFELAGAFKNLMFQSEYVMNGVYGTDLNDEVGVNNAQFSGSYFQAGWLIFGGRYQYNRGEGEFTQIKQGKTWGDLELAFRYDFMSLNDFDAKIYGGGANGYTVGLHYFANHNVSFKLDYSYLDFDRYANYKGKLYIGKDATGDLTKNPFAVDDTQATPGEKFGMIQLRCEIDF